MGARAPPSTRPRRGGFKCEFCGRFLTSAEGLLSHQRSLHSFALKELEKRKKSLQPASKVIQKPVLRKTVVSKAAKVSKVAKPPVKIAAKIMADTSKTEENLDDESASEVESEKEIPVTITYKNSDVKNDEKTEYVSNNEGETVGANSFNQDKSSMKRRMHFQCPKCVKIFYVYFSAMKHIQKTHCLGQGEIETMSDPDLRPILVEYCFYCDTKYTDSHVCQAAITDVVSYMCTDCDEPFRTMKMYDIHISGVHSDALEALFFPTEMEFIEWKNEMELQTATKYSKMEKYGNKNVYRCSHTWPKDINNIAFFCPSTIFTQKFPQGLQTHFYTNHSHECEEYIASDKYKSKSVTELLPQTEGYPDINSDDKFDENDLYLQFKKLMETIVVDAAKINIATLKELVNKAIEMTTVVANYDDDRDFDPTSYNTGISPTLTYKSTSKDIKTALETIRSSQRLKRKVSAEVMSNKKAKVPEPKSPILPKIQKVQSLSLPDDKNSDKRKIISEVTSNKKANVSEPKSPILPKIQKVHSFSLADDKDSDKILKELDNDSNKITKNGKSVKWQTPSDEQENFKTTHASPKIQPKSTIGSPTPSFNDTYKDFITTIQKPDTKDTNKTKIKTKMGQFKPNLSPRNKPGLSPKNKPSLSPKNKPSLSPKNKPTTSHNYRRHSSGNVKVLKYEVKEREDDCNILILKV